MAWINPLAAAVARARTIVALLDRDADERAREEARLAEARRLDGDEVGRRADARRAAREAASGGRET